MLHVILSHTPLTARERYHTTSAGFEPARAKPNRFQVYLLNHSDTMSISNTIYTHIIFLSNLTYEYFHRRPLPLIPLPCREALLPHDIKQQPIHNNPPNKYIP